MLSILKLFLEATTNEMLMTVALLNIKYALASTSEAAIIATLSTFTAGSIYAVAFVGRKEIKQREKKFML